MVSVGVSRMEKTRVFIDPGAKVNCSHYCNIVIEKVYCLTLKQYNVITGGHCRMMERQRTPLGPRLTIWKKEHINSIELHMWPPNRPDINPVDYAIWGALAALRQRVCHQR